MTAVRGLAGLLADYPGERIEGREWARAYGWWLRGESGVLWRRLPAAALAGWGPGGIDVWAGHAARDAALQRDVAPSGPRRPALARFYDSRIAQNGLFGPGWRSCWDVFLQDRGATLAYHDEWGRVLEVPRPASGHQVILADESLTLACLDDGRYVVADLLPAYRYFTRADSAGMAGLDALEFLDGHRIQVRRDEQGRIAALTDATNEGLWFAADARGRLVSASRGPGGEPCAVFAYGAEGRLASVDRGRGKAPYRYGYQEGLLSEIADGVGSWSIRWRNEGAGMEVAGLRAPGGRMWLLHRDRMQRSARMVSADGREMRWQFDDSGRVMEYLDAENARYRLEYDERSRPAAVDTPSGRYAFTYDVLGRVVAENGPGGFSRRVSYAYATRLPMLLTREGGRHWFWMRDAQLRPIQRRAPGGEVSDYAYIGNAGRRVRRGSSGETRYSYDALGRLERREMPDGNVENFVWTAAGRLRASQGAGGAVEVREYDDADGLRVRRGKDARMRLSVYGPQGKPLSIANAAGHARHWRYDAQGRLEMRIDEEGAATRYARHPVSREWVVQGPGGGTQRWGRDAQRRLRARQDADGVVVEHRHDTLGRVTCVAQASGSARLETTIGYDGLGRMMSREREGHRWEFEHDAMGRLMAVRAVSAGAQDSLLTFEYGAGGRVVRESGAHGALTVTRDALGHPASIELPCGLALLTARDPAQGLVQLSYAYEEKPTAILTIRQDAAGREHARLAGRIQRVIERDERQGVRMERVRLASGNRDEADALARRARRDAAGRLIEVEDAAGRVLHDYDRRGQLVRTICESGIVYTTWDAGGNVIALDSAGWAPLWPSPDHRVRRVGQMTLSYDEWGRVVRRDGPLASAAFSWDAAGRLTRAVVNGVAVSYVYDAAGRLVGRRGGAHGKNASHVLLWEGLRLIQETTPGWRATYVYEPAPAGWLSYAPAARLVQRRAHAQAAWSAPEVQYLFSDAAGRVQAVTDGNGLLLARAGRRPWGERFGASDAHDTLAPPDFAGQWSDPDTLLCWNGVRFYDPLTARYMSPDRTAPAGVSPYRYVSAPACQANPTGRAVRARGIGERAGVMCRWAEPAVWARARPPVLFEPDA